MNLYPGACSLGSESPWSKHVPKVLMNLTHLPLERFSKRLEAGNPP